MTQITLNLPEAQRQAGLSLANRLGLAETDLYSRLLCDVLRAGDAMQTMERFRRLAGDVTREEALAILDQVAARPPDPGDEWPSA